MKKILITAYDVNPYKGSESGMGWNFIDQVSRFYDVIAVTRINNRENIEKYLEENPLPDTRNIEFIYYDLPIYLRFWKKGERGSSLYFFLWQMIMPLFLFSKRLKFDIAHNLNFHADWAPSFLWMLRKPFIWGPILHHPKVPRNFIHSFRDYFKNRLTWFIKKYFWNFSLSHYLSRNTAAYILPGHSKVIKELSLGRKNKTIFTSVGTTEPNLSMTIEKDGFRIVSVGRFVYLKAFDVAIQSFILFLNSLPEDQRGSPSLTLIGKGPEKNALMKMINESNYSKQIEIIDWMERDQLWEFYQKSHIFLFPSHEGAGMVVAEAMSCGLPVVCFDNCGPGELIDERSGIRVPCTDFENSTSAFGRALLKLYHDRSKLTKLSVGAKKLYREKYQWDAKGDFLHQVYEQVLMANR